MSIRIELKQLRFALPNLRLDKARNAIESHTNEVREIAKNAGTGSDKFQAALVKLQAALGSRGHLADAINTPIDLRALAVELNSKDAIQITLDSRLFHKIDSVRSRPGSLLVEAIYSHYLRFFDHLDNVTFVESWLMRAKELRGELDDNAAKILSGKGPKWLAEGCEELHIEFDTRVEQVGLLNYTSGRFLAIAKNIHYLSALRNLEPGQNHRVLKEVQKPAVFESLYEDGTLLGHEVLKILISRADDGNISDKWMNVIMAIAGDPRVSKQNERYIRWWSQIPESLIGKVRGWLSKLDLRLFLEALKNYATVSNDLDLSRMYPSRKKFLEGLLKQELVTSTRLFLTEGARDYLYRHYKKEHLPSFSIVDGDKSIIYFSMPGVHVVEGTHMCKFWIYKNLSESAAVLNYNRNRFAYAELTNGMNLSMVKQKVGKAIAAITHNGSWQAKVAIELNKAGVEFDPEVLLMRDDYIKYRDSGYL